MLLFIFTIFWVVTLYYFLFKLIKILIFRNRFKIEETKNEILPTVSVIIPARNEEHNISYAVLSLLDQSYPKDRYEIIVVNDNSTDDTENIVKEIAQKHKRVKLISKDEPEEGWTGKSSACFKGAENLTSDYLCFVDADTKSKRDLLKAAVTFALKNEIDMFTVSPFQELRSFSEKVFLPGVFLLIASSINFNKVNNPSKPEAIANGQFIMFKREVYEKTGGHSAVKSIVMEDIALAEMIKNRGFKLFFIFGDSYISTRMYSSVMEIWDGFSKNISVIMKTGSDFTTLISSCKSFFLGAAPVVIPAFLFFDTGGFSDYTILAYLLGILSLLIFGLIALREMGISVFYLLLFPLGFVLHGFITINSIFKKRKGRTVWKGRKY